MHVNSNFSDLQSDTARILSFSFYLEQLMYPVTSTRRITVKQHEAVEQSCLFGACRPILAPIIWPALALSRLCFSFIHVFERAVKITLLMVKCTSDSISLYF